MTGPEKQQGLFWIILCPCSFSHIRSNKHPLAHIHSHSSPLPHIHHASASIRVHTPPHTYIMHPHPFVCTHLLTHPSCIRIHSCAHTSSHIHSCALASIHSCVLLALALRGICFCLSNSENYSTKTDAVLFH